MVEKEFMHYTLEDADNPDGWDKNIKTSRFMKPKSYRQSNRGFQTKVLHGWEFFF
jgi:hypothetical protein